MKKQKTYDSLLETVAKNIQNQRKRCEITQEGMTEHGFNYRHYQSIESGKYSMNLYTLYRLSRTFKTDISTFFNTPDQKNHKKRVLTP